MGRVHSSTFIQMRRDHLAVGLGGEPGDFRYRGHRRWKGGQ